MDDLGVGVRMVSGKGSWVGLRKCDASDLGKSGEVGVAVSVSEEGRKSKRMKEEKRKRKRKGKGMSKSGEVGVGVRMKEGKRKRMSKSGEVGVAVSEEGTDLSRDLELYFPSTNVDFEGISEPEEWTDLSLLSRDIGLYFPSTNVDFVGISQPDYGDHPIQLTYPSELGRKGFKIVQGKQLKEDVVSLLSNGVRRNYLVRNNGVEEPVDSCIARKYLLICCFKVPLLDNVKAAHHARAMIAAYNVLRSKNENFEMVVVAKMASPTMAAVGGGDEEAAFNRFFEAFPCLAVPFWDAQSRDFLCLNLGLTEEWEHSAAIVVDPNQVVLQTRGDCFYKFGPSGFPYTPDRIQALTAQHTQTRRRLMFLFNDDWFADPVSLVQLLGSDILLSRFGGSGKISASKLTKKRCVILYICMNGELMEMLERIRVRESLRGRQCEVVVIPVPFLWDTPSFVNAVQLALEKNKLSSWWVMPSLVGDEEATRNLWWLCEKPEWDQLMFLSHGGRAMELDGKQLVEDYMSTIEYPFTMMSLAYDVFQRLRSLTLDSLLPRPCINSDRGSVPVSQLNGSKLLLHLDYCENVCRRDGPLYKDLLRYYDSKKDSQVEVVSVSLDCNCASPQPWLVHPGRAPAIVNQLFPHAIDNVWPALVAFGEDGFLLSREAQHHLHGDSLFTDTLFLEIVHDLQRL